jgi:hypothetical protein
MTGNVNSPILRQLADQIIIHGLGNSHLHNIPNLGHTVIHVGDPIDIRSLLRAAALQKQVRLFAEALDQQ